MPNGAAHQARRAVIRRILGARQVSTQEELRSLVAKEGFLVTQATLSRDLAHVGARRVSLPGGGTIYELDEARAHASEEVLRELRGMVISVVPTDALVVLHTLSGAAAAVAAALDRSRLPEVAGTIAGDDCIFIAPHKGTPPPRIARRLSALWLGPTASTGRLS